MTSQLILAAALGAITTFSLVAITSLIVTKITARHIQQAITDATRTPEPPRR